MQEPINRLMVFVGSPSDCKEEHDIVRNLIPEVNLDLQTLAIPLEFSFVNLRQGIFPDVGRPQEIINEQLDKADVVLLFFWHRFGTDAGCNKTGTQEEFCRALELRHRKGTPRVLLYFKDCPLPRDVDLEQLRRLREFRKELETRFILLAGTFQRQDEFKRQVQLALLDEAKKWSGQTTRRGIKDVLAPPASAKLWSEKRDQIAKMEGFSSTTQVFDHKKLEGRVFAIELLTEPQQFLYKDRQKIVRLDRRHTSDAIYTGPARRELRDLCLDTHEIGQWAQRVDREIHDFFLGKHECDLELPLDKCPLRWASGGVFPVVSYQGRTWTSFFFRDIWPEGWNIPLGASEVTDNLQDPWSFLWREFLEELLVLRTPPTDRPGQEIEWRRPEFASNPFLQVPSQLADAFSQEHIKLRRECDGMNLRASADRPLRLDAHPTGTTLEILGAPGGEVHFVNTFFVAVNPLEVGIEIVAPVSYSLDDDDYPLDGEILKPEGSEHELVRMPVALISHEYLRRSFGDIDQPLQFDNASVIGDKLHADDIVIFDWDVRRRLAIANGSVGRGTESERHKRWRKLFGPAFKDAQETGRFSDPMRKFTVTSAKVASYYLS